MRIIFEGPLILIVLLELKLKIPLTIPDSYYSYFMKLSDNFRLIEVLPYVSPVVPLDLCLDLEVLISSDPT